MMAGHRNAPTLQRQMTYRLNVLSKINDMLSQELYLQGTGLSLPQARCLAAVGSVTGELTVNEVAFEANLDKAQVSRTAQDLVERGLMSKRPSPVDGRCVQLALTPQGRACWQQVMALIEQRNIELLHCLSAQEQDQLADMLERMLGRARQQLASSRQG